MARPVSSASRREVLRFGLLAFLSFLFCLLRTSHFALRHSTFALRPEFAGTTRAWIADIQVGTPTENSRLGSGRAAFVPYLEKPASDRRERRILT